MMILEDVINGEKFIITKHGVLVAMLIHFNSKRGRY
jgi:antitoxin (DNA-binding transcriptional repressor) of toxin-antitoxin stability system